MAARATGQGKLHDDGGKHSCLCRGQGNSMSGQKAVYSLFHLSASGLGLHAVCPGKRMTGHAGRRALASRTSWRRLCSVCRHRQIRATSALVPSSSTATTTPTRSADLERAALAGLFGFVPACISHSSTMSMQELVSRYYPGLARAWLLGGYLPWQPAVHP